MEPTLDRRTFLRSTGVVTAAGALAGCSGSGGSGGDGGDGGGGDGGSDGGGYDGGGSGDETVESSSDVSEWVSASDNYDGKTLVLTGQDEVTVAVGAEGNGGAFAFDPPAIKVSTGTTVVWDWTGEGGTHNVVAEDGTFDSGSAVSGSDVTFEHTFEETGTFLYKCVPHASLGMKGAVVVE
ncbi:MAG: halocyanin domain-containing protein [Haloarculaceae archaeon]